MTSLISQVSEVEKYFTGSKYNDLVNNLQEAFWGDDVRTVKIILNKFPTKDEMFKELIENLKGKSVYKTLEKIVENETNDKACTNVELLKALFSLGTHAVIECQLGNIEYKMLLVSLYSKIGDVLFKE